MITYTCDGSTKRRYVGVGVVRREGNTIKKYDFNFISEGKWLNIHEQKAIDETLNLVEQFNDKHVLVFNDDIGLIERIKHMKLKENYENQILEKIETNLLKRISTLQKKGFNLTFESDKNNIYIEDLDSAHHLSRTSLRDWKNKKKNKNQT